MEAGKFETEARAKLADRELKPSAGSWEKIAGSLDASERNTAGRKWYYITAAMVVFAIISGSFLINNNTRENRIVEEPVNEIKTPPEIKQHNEVPFQFVEVEKETQAGNEVKIAKFETQASRKTLHPVLAVQSEELKFEKVLMPKTAIKVSPGFQDDFEGYLVEAIKVSENKDLAETEVDQLLAEAAARLSEKYNKPNSGKINAESLLAEVENDLDQSFRRKVFELLKEGFEEASYAFSNRNN